jgi:hypothetical protein
MNILIGGFLILCFVFYVVMNVISLRKKTYTEFFNAENLPSVQEQASNELINDGLGE